MITTGACSIRSWRLIRIPYSPNVPLPLHTPFSFTRRRRLFATTACSSWPKRSKEKVIVISGPTGAGKSRLATELAKRLNGEIISADLVQVYQGLDVGSAKPSPSDRKEVPHHLVDILHPSEEYSAGKFYDNARQATIDILIKSSGLPPSAFQVPYNSFKEVSDSSVLRNSHESNFSIDKLEDKNQHEERNSRDLDYDFNCFFLSSQRVDLYRSIDFRCEDRPDGFLTLVFFRIQIPQLEQLATDKLWSTY